MKSVTSKVGFQVTAVQFYEFTQSNCNTKHPRTNLSLKRIRLVSSCNQQK